MTLERDRGVGGGRGAGKAEGPGPVLVGAREEVLELPTQSTRLIHGPEATFRSSNGWTVLSPFLSSNARLN